MLATGHPSSIPAAEVELDIRLSPELLAVLDEPIDPEDEIGGTGSDLGTAAPPGGKRPTTSGSEVLVRGPTEGGPGTNAATPITSATPSLPTSMSRRIPASEPTPPRPSQQTQIAMPESLPPVAPSTVAPPPPPPLQSEPPPPPPLRRPLARAPPRRRSPRRSPRR